MGSRRRSRRVVVSSSFLIASFGAGAHAQSTVRIDIANDGTESTGAAMEVDVCDDGTRVVFASYADGLDPADVNGHEDVLLRDLVAGTTTLVSVRTSGKQAIGDSRRPRISGDGKFVAFDSDARNLVNFDTNGVTDVFLHDLVLGTTKRVSVASDGTEGDGPSGLVAISGDGNRVLFRSDAKNLVAGDTNGFTDLFLRDVAAGSTIRVSTAADGTEADSATVSGDMSRDGQIVLMMSYADNLVTGDTNEICDVFVHDLVAGTVVRASVDSNGGELVWGGGNPYLPDGNAISPDGRLVAFPSFVSDLASGDDNNAVDVFLRDLTAGTTTAISVDSAGSFSPMEYPIYGVHADGISDDGRFILMEGAALELAAHERTGRNLDDVYIRDRTLSMTTRQSDDPGGDSGDAPSMNARMSIDGLQVVFVSQATNLIGGHPTSGKCAFLVTRTPRAGSASEYGTGFPGSLGVPSLALSVPPVLNTPDDLLLGNSFGGWTPALLVIGLQSAQLPTSLGGDLLVLPHWTVFVAVPPGGLDSAMVVPPEERLASLSVYVQALELDPGAAKGVSFSAGLEVRAGF